MARALVTFFTVIIQLHALFHVSSASCSCGQPGQGPAASGTYDILTGMSISSPGKWCWQAALQSETGSIFCTAIIIDRLYAITPAQCIFGRQANTTFLRTGSFDLSGTENSSQILAVDRLIVNEGYLNVDTSNEFNIGVIKLQAPIDCSTGSVCMACLPASNSPAPRNDTTCFATTWNNRVMGAKSTPRPMRERPASIMNQIDCELAIRGDNAIQSDYHVVDSKFCLKEATDSMGQCLGDLGDPLVCLNKDTGSYEVIGLNTIGFSCFRRTLPSFYVRVAVFADWIANVTNRLQSQGRSLPATFTIPDFAQPIPIQKAAVVPVVVLAPGSSVSATTPPPAVAALPVGVIQPVDPAMTFMKPMVVSTQRMGADGSMEQVAADGSVQRQQAMVLPPVPQLQQVAPGVFRANLSDSIATVAPVAVVSGSGAPVVPNRQRRDTSLTTGLIAPNSSLNPLNVPIINVAASDVGYNPTTGKFEFKLPQGQTAFSSVSFVPSSVEDIRNQIIAQRDKILAQVNNFKQNILVSISGNFPDFAQQAASPVVTSNTPLSLGSAPNLAPVATSVSTNSNAGMAAANAAASNQRSMVAPQMATAQATSNAGGMTSPVLADDSAEYDDVAPPPSPASQMNAGRVGTISSSASAAGNQGAVGPVPVAVSPNSQSGTGSGFRTVVDRNTPTSGGFKTNFNSGNSQGSASASFQGNKVHAETVHAPGSSSSSVSASS